MKATLKPTVEKIVPMDEAYLQKEYGLTPKQAKSAVEKISAANTRSKAEGKVTKISGAFDENYFA